MKTCTRIVAPLLLALAHAAAFATAPDFDQELGAIIRDYDRANYDTPDNDAKIKGFEAVAMRAANLAKQYPSRGEALVWQGQAQASQAAADRSLGLVKQARKTLDAAVAITPNASAADAYSTLGSLYANLPGFPLSFGDKKKARVSYQKALAINPAHVGANLNYAQLLLKDDDYAGVVKHANVALSTLPRPGREKADKAARTSAENLIAKAKEELR